MASFSLEQIRLFDLLHTSAAAMGLDIYVVGGVVRDLYLEHTFEDKDLDFMIGGDARPLAERLAGELSGTLKTFPRFYTAKILNPASFKTVQEIDLASSRTETYPNPGALPEVSLAAVSEDLRRRDFSINAMAIPLTDLRDWLAAGNGRLDDLWPKTMDPFNGRQDLTRRRVRVLHDRSFIDDPTRIFRAARYAARLEGQPTDETALLLKAALIHPAFEAVSPFRKVTEIKRVFDEAKIEPAIRLLAEWGVFERFGLFSPAAQANVLSWLGDSSALKPYFSSAEFYEVLFALFLGTLGQESGISVYGALGFGKKILKRMWASWETAGEETNPAKLADSALAIAYLRAPDGAVRVDLLSELRRRRS